MADDVNPLMADFLPSRRNLYDMDRDALKQRVEGWIDEGGAGHAFRMTQEHMNNTLTNPLAMMHPWRAPMQTGPAWLRFLLSMGPEAARQAFGDSEDRRQ